MVKQNLLAKRLEQKISELDLDTRLIDEITKTINDNFTVTLADSVQDKLEDANVDAWKKGKAIPTDPIIRDALASLLKEPNKNFFNLILDSEDAMQILVDALNKYHQEIMADDLHDFKLKAFNGNFDRIKHNPYSSKVTRLDLMGCIAYLKVSGYLFGKNLGLTKNKKLNLKLYKQIMDLPRLVALVNPNQLLLFLQKNIEKKGKVDPTSLQKSALLYLLLVITGDSFFKL
ncbi:hypothetical protein [uncultured Lactobacillus sp.]|uniref:hypothetical protein n=1 Tax=uncultured Lactobacillus sp. TaxID=153152 RepID=UPI0026292D9A|nr:hypothetical protein [uncultured Lactobacillus sp.]